MANKSIKAANLAADVIAGYLDRAADNSTESVFTYVTEKPHNFFVGALVNVSGLSKTTSTVIAGMSATITSGAASIPNVGMALFSATNFFPVGAEVRIAGLTSTAYNGDFKVIGRTNSSFWVYNTATATITLGSTNTAKVLVNMNVVNGIVANVDNPTTFSVVPPAPIKYEAGVTMTGPATAQLINGSLNSVKIAYAQPEYYPSNEP